MTKTLEDIYRKYEPIEAILKRPDTYIGNTEKITDTLYVFKDNRMTKEELTYSPGFLKIFDEVLSNAVDHTHVDTTINLINVNIDKVTGIIEIYNNGKGIPIHIHSEYAKYIPEFIFGELHSSTNYDDTESRTKAGRNGVGVKLCNIFSKFFKVETVDSTRKLQFIQEYTDNMSVKTEPKVSKCNFKTGFTRIIFLPDYARFNMKNLDDDTYNLLVKRIIDAIPCTSKSVNISINDVKCNCTTFNNYINYYSIKDCITESNKEDKFGWDISLSTSKGVFECVSFANGVCTVKGGTHVTYIINQITKKLTELIEKKKKIKNVKANLIKEHLFLFINLVTNNPKFNTQSKEELTTPSKDFTIKYKISDEFIEKFYKKNQSIISEIIDLTNFKNSKELAKNDGSSTRKLTHLNIPKLDDAHFAGTKKSKECTLILIEGDSAKQFAIAGISILKNGRDYFGIFPLRGKLINVKNASDTQCSANAELTNIKKILGLEHNKKYSSLDSLRYGRVLILTDQDLDGMHINSLINNMFHTWWPELLEIKGFITALRTPILKVFNKDKLIKEFYTEYEYKQWVETKEITKFNTKYFKGLGTTDSIGAKEIFKNFVNNLIVYIPDKLSNASFNLAFESTSADKRKVWLGNYKKESILEYTKNEVTFTELINKGLIHFSMYDIIRSIPGIDGLKPSQRKILHTLFSIKNNNEIKVANLAGKVSDFTEYHHGEDSLKQAIVSLAQNYIGTNNYNLLDPRGQFGTRVTGQAASPRYIFTAISEFAKVLFHQDDFNILEYHYDEDKQIEPVIYMPLLPISLLNGSDGIGTGYSTFIPPFNIKSLIKNIYCILNNEDHFDELQPYYKHFKGTIDSNGNGKYVLNGEYMIKKNILTIKELPPGIITDTYKANVLDKLIESNIVKYKKCDSTIEDIHIEIEFVDNTILLQDSSYLKKLLKLTKSISCNNFHLFDKDYKIKHYKDANEILKDFVEIRLQYYTKRKGYLLNSYTEKLLELKNKIKFLEYIMDDTITIFKKKSQEIDNILDKHSFDLINSSYSYLKTMHIDSFTIEKISLLKEQFNKFTDLYNKLKPMTEKKMYLNDLRILLTHIE